MASKIYVGIGGWTFEPWRGVFYPSDLVQRRELEFASRAVTSIEINGTYYGSQKPESFRKWASEVPDGFIFSLKGPRFATNRRVLAEAGDSVMRFYDSGVLELKDRLGPVLWQFAPTKKFDGADFGKFLELLPRKLDGRALRHVVEQRALKDERVRRVDDHQPRDPLRVLQCRHPRDRAAPVMADQRKAIDPEMIGEREHIRHEDGRSIIFHPVRLGGSGIAALIRGQHKMVLRQERDLVPPGAVRFGKSVEQNDRRIGRVARHHDVKLDAGRQGNAALRYCLHHGPLVQSDQRTGSIRPISTPQHSTPNKATAAATPKAAPKPPA